MFYKNQIENIAQRYNLLEIYVFGSRAQEMKERVEGKEVESACKDSDLDVGVRVNHPADFDSSARVRLSVEMEDLFGVGRVDLIVLNESAPFLALEAIKGCLLFTRDPDDQARYELYVMRRAGDLLPFKNERMKAILNEGAR